MNTNAKWILGLVIAAALAGGGYFLLRDVAKKPAISVALTVQVEPNNQTAFVLGHAQSARFKYLMGKLAGVKPVLAQRMTVELSPDGHALRAQVGVETKEEGKRFVDGFVETLQLVSGKQVSLRVVEQTVR